MGDDQHPALPASVHTVGDHAFVPHLIRLARETGVSAHLDDGTNRWPAVHQLDAARLYRNALQTADAAAVLHAAAEEDVPPRAVTETIGDRLSAPVVPLDEEEATTHFGWILRFARNDNPTSSTATRKRYNWHPQEPGLLADLNQNHYYA
ncbi:hypothetical protein [Streptomyces sp. NPDC058108]|uniref:hypothetical protein n=1 Tax=Streptomyces sp. NPDC058108 TaxID=3346344 RepID=UPI0036E5A15F